MKLSLVKEEVIKLNKRFNKPKPILKIDKDTNRVIKRYESIKEAARDNLIEPNCIRRALEGIYKTSCGYKWCYENK